MENLYEFDQEFKNTIATVDEKGKRVWVYPKKPSGKYHKLRIAVTIVLLAILFGGPFITIDGRPFLLLNIFERKFVILGQAFWPQDFFLLALLLIIFFVFIILFTVIFGRVWCGWACPQTLFMEMVFRKIEYWIEGDANQQRKLDKQSWDFEKIRKKGFKHFIFIGISLLISHTVMAYLIGIDQVVEIVSQPPSEHLAGFIGLMFFTGVFYWVFAWFREQACVAVCPYGRLQGVLLDKKSIAVMYDWLRGEPRGKLKKGTEQELKGDCIDCKLCVHACPTGIDIRNGTQLECVNCTACIDACDDVMLKINKPKGLIRYASHEAIEKGKQKLFTPRVAAYSFVLLFLMSIFIFSLTTRSDIETTVLKVPGQLYERTEDGKITNLYNVQFVNKTFEEVNLELKIEDEPDAVISKVGNGEVVVPANGLAEGVFFISIPHEKIGSAKMKLTIGIYSNGQLIEKTKTNFLGPVSLN
ncbi:Type cbb3 cytochrome oxidase biogenesis protein CcoG, involved in Cu oxidation [Fulvivirga imtechensis AK7]|uniref:Type cbb3 cytochrome oxidase biogenesis protein CcoG, involved in Cu oxidation n=1 Tax=Fulvivirga imtechensis AK7 TaxID=1237149 RepID=L8JPL4_9BACT|nr:cytochrome c oxidase accessory protein CcoG [Fulvivirga imtechensis]ELR70755.1 Type cbb3 cytochrome oxidase biogenesis protein CcoG, involved in Cu oxidation [Fulvivirga imtechensis AK7]